MTLAMIFKDKQTTINPELKGWKQKMDYSLGRIGIVVYDSYDETKTYQPLDLVPYLGGSYIARCETVGNLPTDTAYWTPISTSGATPSIELRSDGTYIQWKVGDGSWENLVALSELGNDLMDSPIGNRMVLLENDFQNVDTFAPFRSSTPGGGSAAETNGEANHPGVVIFKSGTGNPSGYSCMTDEGAFLLAGGEVARLKFSPLSVSNLVMRFGFCDAFTSQGSVVVDGVYMNVSGATLTGKTSNNSVTTNGTTATSFTLVVGAWYDATVEVKYINGLLTGVFNIRNEAGDVIWTDSLTTNIPTASGRNVGAGVVVMRAASTATSMAKIDYLGVGILRDLTR